MAFITIFQEDAFSLFFNSAFLEEDNHSARIWWVRQCKTLYSVQLVKKSTFKNAKGLSWKITIAFVWEIHLHSPQIVVAQKRNDIQRVMWQLFVLLLASIPAGSPMMPDKLSTSSAMDSDPSPLMHLIPPANISACKESNYCNNGACLIISPTMTVSTKLLANVVSNISPTVKVSCRCNNTFVDSEAGLCTIEGKSRRTAFIIRCYHDFWESSDQLCSWHQPAGRSFWSGLVLPQQKLLHLHRHRHGLKHHHLHYHHVWQYHTCCGLSFSIAMHCCWRWSCCVWFCPPWPSWPGSLPWSLSCLPPGDKCKMEHLWHSCTVTQWQSCITGAGWSVLEEGDWFIKAGSSEKPFPNGWSTALPQVADPCELYPVHGLPRLVVPWLGQDPHWWLAEVTPFFQSAMLIYIL